MLGYSVATGRFITPADVATSAPVVVLGQSVVNALFGGVYPVGQSVVIDSTTFQVIGTLAPKGYSGSYDQDDLMVIPITAAWKSVTGIPASQIDQVLIRASSPATAAAVAREATAVMLGRHDIVDPSLADFAVHRQSDLLTSQLQAAKAVRRLLEAAALALLIAGAIQVGDRDPDSFGHDRAGTGAQGRQDRATRRWAGPRSGRGDPGSGCCLCALAGHSPAGGRGAFSARDDLRGGGGGGSRRLGRGDSGAAELHAGPGPFRDRADRGAAAGPGGVKVSS